jgi:hypothetical protein
MSVKTIKKYQIICDHCGLTEIIERNEGTFLAPPLPKDWKRTIWYLPRFTSGGPTPGDSVDQCPQCAINKKVDIPENATDVRSHFGKD